MRNFLCETGVQSWVPSVSSILVTMLELSVMLISVLVLVLGSDSDRQLLDGEVGDSVGFVELLIVLLGGKYKVN